MKEHSNIIEIKNLDFSYSVGENKVPIFQSFSLSLSRGDFVALKGPSGSGKSTLIHLLSGLLKFDRGEILVSGNSLSGLSDLELSVLRNKNIGLVFQQFYLLPKLSVLENILLPTLYPMEENKSSVKGDLLFGTTHLGGPLSNSKLKNSGQNSNIEKALALAKNLGIEDRLNHLPNQLSGGQQQRVAIARALINEPDIILADEPTGNLDSVSTQQIVSIFQELHKRGKTILLITHEEDVANVAEKKFFLKDGSLVDGETGNEIKNKLNLSEENLLSSTESLPPLLSSSWSSTQGFLQRGTFKTTPYQMMSKLFPVSFANAFRHKVRSALTMLGIVVGIAAVCSMMTLGSFTKKKILESYGSLGVNRLIFRGFPNWNLRATDKYPILFHFFNWEKELIPLKKIFPDIKKISPSLRNWNLTVSYAGQSIDNEPTLMGVSEDGISALGRKFYLGRGINEFHVQNKDSVCVIGYEIAQRLFVNTSPLNKVLYLSRDNGSLACKVIGVLTSQTTNSNWAKPNLQVFIPFTLFQTIDESWWSSQIHQVVMEVRPGADIEKLGKALRQFFGIKYGVSGRFYVDSDSLLLAQMKKFLDLFSLLLVVIALVTLSVGGMGITNMMLVSLSERTKEIGIRKSVGATHKSLRFQFLLESVILCFFAGIIGIFVGILVYEGAIYGATIWFKKFHFEWVLDPVAIFVSIISIIAVGVLSGLIPALRAEKLQVIDALRSD